MAKFMPKWDDNINNKNEWTRYNANLSVYDINKIVNNELYLYNRIADGSGTVITLGGVKKAGMAVDSTPIKGNNENLITSGGVAAALNNKASKDEIYPVGSIYLSVNKTSPAELFGGTWEQLKDKFLLGAGDTYTNGATGGNENHSHALNNGYAMTCPAWLEPGGNKVVWNAKQTPFTANTMIAGSYWNDPTDGTSVSSYWATSLGGSTDTSDSKPPYLVVYMWKRTA